MIPFFSLKDIWYAHICWNLCHARLRAVTVKQQRALKSPKQQPAEYFSSDSDINRIHGLFYSTAKEMWLTKIATTNKSSTSTRRVVNSSLQAPSSMSPQLRLCESDACCALLSDSLLVSSPPACCVRSGSQLLFLRSNMWRWREGPWRL